MIHPDLLERKQLLQKKWKTNKRYGIISQVILLNSIKEVFTCQKSNMMRLV